MGWNLCEGLFHCYDGMILYTVQYFHLWLNGLFMWEQFILLSRHFGYLCTSKSYEIHSSNCRVPYSKRGLSYEWVLAAGAGRGTST